MKALTWQSKGSVAIEEVPDPRIEEPTDIVVRITSTAICGSDLHLYNVLAPFLEKGDVLGHEFMGIVEEAGRDVTHVAKGDRVVIPFNISCGHCWMCEHDLQSQCETTQVTEYGSGAALFGYTKLYGQVPGGQAQFARVPHADFGAVKLPQDGPDERFLYLSDILPTAWQGARYADVAEGDTVAVLGLGPVGQLAARCALLQGAERVIGVDRVDERLAAAAAKGVETLDMRQVDDVADALRERTGGRGPDRVIDAVGMEAHGSPVAKVTTKLVTSLPKAVAGKIAEHASMDQMAALHTALDAVRRGGTVSLSGVYGGTADPINMLQIFDKGITLRMGQANVRRWTDELLGVIERHDDVLDLENLATHRVPLDKAPEAYDMFNDKADGCIKVVLKP